jgi:hypothetical protein
MFEIMIQDVVKKLSLRGDDVLLEMCCGNGLLTLPLSIYVKQIFAFDFTEHLVETAIKERKNDKIQYAVGDAKSDFFFNFEMTETPTKFLMNDSLGYFSPIELTQIIERITARTDHFLFYITGVPNENLKWNFYNTDERKAEYLVGLASGDTTAKGIGNWWKTEEFTRIAENLKISCVIENQEAHISNYRSNVLFKK